MKPDGGAPIRIEFPLREDVSRAVVAQKAALSRNSVKALFGDEGKYFAAFSVLRADRAIAAYAGHRVVGVLLFKENGDEPFVVSCARFRELWRPVHGTFLWAVFVALQYVQDPKGTYCCAVWVHPDWRAAGIGGQLYARLAEECDDEIAAFARKDAVAFHRRAGFALHGSLYRRVVGWLSGTRPMTVPPRALRVSDAQNSMKRA